VRRFPTIKYQVVQEYNRMQIDLQNPEIYKVIQDGVELKYNREGNVFFIELMPFKSRV
jgi:hypothetical protein